MHTLTGNVRLHRAFHSRFLRNDRDVIVYLPPGYEATPDRRYPVCYMHDGQNLFDAASAFAGHEWGLDEIAEEMITNGEIQPLIIVGIYNAGEARMAEYTHVQNRSRRGGRARAYGNMLVKELKPFIDQEYRSLPDRENTALGGSSLGGLVSAFLGLTYPEVFGNLILMSPSVWWANRDIVKRVAKAAPDLDQKVWLDIGTCEGSDPEACIRDARELRDALVAKGWQPGLNFRYHEDHGAEHHELAWGRRMRDALRFFFPTSATLFDKAL